ncbi:MAG: septum formation initiator family protein [Elusimicrobiota bacterium]
MPKAFGRAAFLKRFGRRWLYIAAAAAVAAVLLGNRGFRSLVSNSLRLRVLKADLAALEREERDIKDRIEAVRTDDLALERAARKELGFQRPGEVEYRFPPPK